MTTTHVSVLLKESIDALAIKPDGIYIDCTFGRGGHSGEILNQLSKDGRLIAIDRDPTAIECAKKYADNPSFIIEHSPFSELFAVFEEGVIIMKIFEISLHPSFLPFFIFELGLITIFIL